MQTVRGDSQLRNLREVLEITRRMAGECEVDALLGLIVDRAPELLNAERCTLWLHDAERGELYCRMATDLDEVRVPDNAGICGVTVRTGQTLVIPDAYADHRFNPEIDRQTGYRTRSILSAPLHGLQGALVGVLQVVNHCDGGFSETDVELAETLAAQAGVAIERADLMRHYVLKQRMQRALEIARSIQQGLLPRGRPDCGDFDVAGFSLPADETGGDAYDYFSLDDGRWLLSVADASGHGVGPALVVAETRAMLRAVAMQRRELPALLGTVNALLRADLNDECFVTCFVGLLDAAKAEVRFASAGHGPLVLYRRSEDAFRRLPGTALPLAVLDEADYSRQEHFAFQPGDFMVVMTDGVFEACAPSGEMFGIERMLDTLRTLRDAPAEGMVRGLRDAVRTFVGDGEQSDDITALAIVRH